MRLPLFRQLPTMILGVCVLLFAHESVTGSQEQEFLTRAADAFASGRLEESLSLYRRTVELAPESVAAYGGLGFVHAKRGEFPQAIAAYRRVLELAPFRTDAALELAAAYRETGQFGEASKAYRSVLEHAPTLTRAYVGMGIVHSELGQFAEAVAAYHRALELEPDLSSAHHNLGLVHSRLGDCEAAIAHYRKAIELRPSLAGSHYGLGLAFTKRGQWREAKAAFQKSVELDPEHVSAYYNLAQTYARLGDEPSRDTALATYQRLREVEETTQRLERIAARNPGNPTALAEVVEAHLRYGQVALEAGRSREARKHFERATVLKPSLAAVHAVLGSLCDDAGETERAIYHYETAIRLDSGQVRAMNNLAWLYVENGVRLDDALKLAREAAALHPHPVHFDTLAWTRYRRGEYEEASVAIRQALNVEPENPEIRAHAEAIRAALSRR